MKTARGVTEVDVYAVEEINGRKYTVACECKKWQSDIPQGITQGFRTVVQDLSCNMGYIITTSDFQTGAFQHVDFTNIELLTWQAFQERFFKTWYDRYFVPTITRELDPLMTYTEPLVPSWFKLLNVKDKRQFNILRNEFELSGYMVMTTFSTYSRILGSEKIPKLPLKDLASQFTLEDSKIPEEIINETGYTEFLDKFLIYGKSAITKFRELRDKYGQFTEED